MSTFFRRQWELISQTIFCTYTCFTFDAYVLSENVFGDSYCLKFVLSILQQKAKRIYILSDMMIPVFLPLHYSEMHFVLAIPVCCRVIGGKSCLLHLAPMMFGRTMISWQIFHFSLIELKNPDIYSTRPYEYSTSDDFYDMSWFCLL